jgi:protein involved in polysaccharide export with SLBB domain
MKNNQLVDENKQLREREQKRLKAEEARALSDSNTATLPEPDTLVNLELNVMHRASSCTVITLGDKTNRYLKTATFDRNNVAQSLLELDIA